MNNTRVFIITFNDDNVLTLNSSTYSEILKIQEFIDNSEEGLIKKVEIKG